MVPGPSWQPPPVGRETVSGGVSTALVIRLMGKVCCFTSGDFGTLGDVLGEVLGDLDVDLRSPVLEVCGGVPGSDADFSVSF